MLDRSLIALIRSGVTAAAAGTAGLLLVLLLLTLLVLSTAVGGNAPGGPPGGGEGDVTRPALGGFVDAIAALIPCSHSRALASLCSAI
jgi:hypothetical protein